MLIKSMIHDYEVKFYDKLCKEISLSYDFTICSQTIYRKYFLDTHFDNILTYSADENKKTIDTSLAIINAFKNVGLNKSSRVLAIGGGFIQDLVACACSLYYRQIPWTFMPTTILAMADSGVGGKYGVNYKGYKNLLGSFYPPNEIIIVKEFIETLSEKDYYSGLGEIAKIYFMHGLDFNEKEDIMTLIKNAIHLKKKIVEKDEFDKAERINLNYGHTFGHALEKTSDYKVPHGTAVMIGVAIANNISQHALMIKDKHKVGYDKVISNLIKTKLDKKWFEPEELIEAAMCDKKKKSKYIKMVLLNISDREEIPYDAFGDYPPVNNMLTMDVRSQDIEMAINRFVEEYNEHFIN